MLAAVFAVSDIHRCAASIVSGNYDDESSGFSDFVGAVSVDAGETD
jgi:hypothetical protein